MYKMNRISKSPSNHEKIAKDNVRETSFATKIEIQNTLLLYVDSYQTIKFQKTIYLDKVGHRILVKSLKNQH